MKAINRFGQCHQAEREATATDSRDHGHRRSLVGSAVAGMCCLLLAATGPSNAGTLGAARAHAGAAHFSVQAARSAVAVKAAQAAGEVWRGQSVAALTQGFWQRLVSIPPGVTPAEDDEGLNRGINQPDGFWFVGGPVVPSFSRSCVIPAGRAIVVPLFAVFNDFPCPDLSFKPAPGQSLEVFLLAGIAPFIDGVSLVDAQLDARTLKVRRVATPVFGFTGAAGLTGVDPCITGSPQLGVSDGHWVFIDPPPRGDHVLLVRVVSDVLGSSEGTYTLKIR